MKSGKPESITSLIKGLLNKIGNVSYSEFAQKWKEEFPERDVPNTSLFNYARSSWKSEEQEKTKFASASTPKKQKRKKIRRFKQKETPVVEIQPRSPNALSGRLLKLETELDEILLAAAETNDKESVEMIRKMRRIVGSRILAIL